MSKLLAEVRKKKFFWAVIASALIVYLVLAIGCSWAKAPWSDEGHFANPALNLITKGSMGTTVIDESSGFLKGINLHTYWVMPLYLLVTAGWFKVFGFSLLAMRLLSVAWGVVALASWYFILKALTKDRSVVLWSLTFIACDYYFIMLASDGRMDMMSAALGFAAYAVYLYGRERNLLLTVLASQALVTASGLTHPSGILAFVGLLFLTLYLDRARIGWRHVLVAAVPYLVGGIGWGLYILQSPSDFAAQFNGNVNGISGLMGYDRMVGLTSPLRGLKLEITQRYIQSFGFAPETTGPARLKIFILIAYVFGIIGSAFTRELRRQMGTRLLLLLTLIYFLIFTLFEGHKSALYLVYITPFFAALLGIWIHYCWKKRLVPVSLIALCAGGLLLLEIGGMAYLIKQNPYRNDYLPAANFLKSNTDSSMLIIGDAELGFELGFDNLVNDFWCGYYSGKRPEFLAVNKEYEVLMQNVFRKKQPEVYQYYTRLIDNEYQLVYELPARWKIYKRRPTNAPA